MIRFHLRSRHRNTQSPRKHPPAPSPQDRPHTPPQKRMFNPRTSNHSSPKSAPVMPLKSPPPPNHSPAARTLSSPTAPPSSYLVNYEALPRRNRYGHALQYPAYIPSRYYISSSARTRRRARPSAPDQPTSNMSSQTSRTLDLGLDFDSVARLANKPPDLQLHLVPLEKRIHAKILQLRRLRAHGDSLGDQQVLNDLVAIHQANASRLKHEADTRRHHLREARIIAGISDTTADPDRSNLVRRVSGKPIRHISGRTVSALKARTSAIRSASKNSRTSVEKRDERFQNRHHAPPGPSPGKPDMSRLSRKSSARLKRLGSAGSVLIRRLSKVSVSEDASSGSSADAPASSTFDQNTMKRLKMTPKEVIAEISAELKRLEDEERIEMAKLTESKKLLSERRGIHEKAMAILDQFYGSLPGWEDDPIAQRLFPETAEMTEAGLEAERDLVDARDTRERARAAYADHGRALNGLLAICTELNLFIEHLEQLLFYIDQCESSRRAARSPPQVSRDVGGTLRKLEAHLDKCVHNARLGVECCSDAPRLTQLQNDLENLSKGFAHEANAVITEGTIYHSDLGPTLQVAKAALCDCKLAETFVSERQRLISEDVESFENQVERCEEYVMLERIGILDMHHPPANDR